MIFTIGLHDDVYEPINAVEDELDITLPKDVKEEMRHPIYEFIVGICWYQG